MWTVESWILKMILIQIDQYFPACRAVRLGVVYFTQSSVIITR